MSSMTSKGTAHIYVYALFARSDLLLLYISTGEKSSLTMSSTCHAVSESISTIFPNLYFYPMFEAIQDRPCLVLLPG